MREVFRGHHQTEGYSAEKIVSAPGFDVARVSLFSSQIKVESKEHEEDEQRVFLTNAIDGDCIYAYSPKCCGQQSGPTIEEGCGKEEKRQDG
jgi:hypothetical protein